MSVWPAAPDLEPERDACVVVRQDRAQIAGAHQLGNGARVARIGLAFASRETPAGAVRRDARRVHQREALGQKRGFQEAGERAHHVDADDDLAVEPRAKVHRHRLRRPSLA